MIFNKNDMITLEDDSKLYIHELLGEGGQGEVYLVDYNNKCYALKMFKERECDDFIYNLKNNISRGSPSNTFLWPKSFVELDDGKIGYIMDLRPKNYKSFISYLNGKVDFKNLSTLLKWCIELCCSFKKLHEKGFSYQDLNDGSFFLDPDTGDLLICDNDNVMANTKYSGILGKMRYMAPEIVKGEMLPDVHSDRFSLAIILFLAFCKGNPYEGERLKNYDILDENAELELFGNNPIFIYHKIDKTNRPIRGYHTTLMKRWPLLPNYIQEAFHRTFVDGLIDRENDRVTELEWIKLLTKYRDELVTCSCNGQYYYGIDNNVNQCPFCNKSKPKRLALYINKHNIILEPGKEIFETHFDKYSTNYNNVIGKVVQNKNRPELWGLLIKHNGATIEDSQGCSREIEANKVIPIIKDAKITFGDSIATINLI